MWKTTTKGLWWTACTMKISTLLVASSNVTPLKIMVSKWNLLFQGLIFRFHVKLRGCMVAFPECILYYQMIFHQNIKSIQCYSDLDPHPTQHASGKWRFSLGFPITLVVTIRVMTTWASWKGLKEPGVEWRQLAARKEQKREFGCQRDRKKLGIFSPIQYV